jgi:hypothetical protein
VNAPPSVTGVREGELLAGKYRIDKILGVGGMGVVVAAHHLHLDDRVAIKFLLHEMLGNGEAVARFAREARAAVKIKSEHVARVSDVGSLENGAPYMVMEYLEGWDLAGWLKQRGALPVEQAVELVLQACEAIAEAHTLGIIHRDLKPANLFVIRRPDGPLSVKVLDFGISKMSGIGSSIPDVSITKTSAMMGSPIYMSPEQMQSAKDVDSRTDIWALGIILYELISGESPFMAESVPELVAKILSMPPPLLRSKRPDAPDGLEAVILKCLDKDRGRRFESVAELAHALMPFAPRRSRLSLDRISGVMRAAGLSGGTTALPPSSDPTELAARGTQAAWGRTNAPRGRTMMTVVAGTVVLSLVAGALFLLRKPAATLSTDPSAIVAAPPTAASPSQIVAPATRAPLPLPEPKVTTSGPAALPTTQVAQALSASPIPARTARPRAGSTSAPTAEVKPARSRPSPLPAPVASKAAAAPKGKPGGAFDDRM